MWGDGPNVVLESLDDDKMLAQSCTDWLSVQRWYTVVLEPSIPVTLWALMGAFELSRAHELHIATFFCLKKVSGMMCGNPVPYPMFHLTDQWSGL